LIEILDEHWSPDIGMNLMTEITAVFPERHQATALDDAELPPRDGALPPKPDLS
jgi:hypothetical protein